MAYVMPSKQFVDKAIYIMNNYKTVYGMGMPGMPITNPNITEKVNQDKLKAAKDRWWTPAREARIRELVGKGYFGFDCVCFEKAILWGWSGDFSKRLGGAKYLSNGVPDWGANHTNKMGIGRSTNFSKIELGHYVWLDGHIGFYIGNGLAIECSPKWKNGVQVSAVLNIGKKAGYNGRTWTTHGKLPWLDYGTNVEKEDDTVFARTIKFGDEGKDVAQTQRFLKALGYYSGPIDSRYGPGEGMRKGVLAFQKDKGLDTDAKVGPLTQDAMLETMLVGLEQTPIVDDTKVIELEKQVSSLNTQVSELNGILKDSDDYFILQAKLQKRLR